MAQGNWGERSEWQLRMPWKTTLFLILWFAFCYHYRWDDRTRTFVADLFYRGISVLTPW